MIDRQRFNLFRLMAATLLLLGCSRGNMGTVEGTVFVNGEPTGGLEIAYKNDADGSMALGATQADGRYELRIGRGERQIAVGSYHVTVTPSEMVTGVPKPDVRMPSKYLSHEETDLVQTVNPGANTLDLNIDIP